MRRVLGRIDTISEWTGKGISMFIFFIIGLLIWEVTLRYVFGAPTIWVHEACEHMFGVYSILLGAYVLLHFQHIKVDIIYNRFSPRWRAILDLVTYPLFFLFVVAMLVHGWKIAWHSVEIMEVSPSHWAPPLYPLKICLVVGPILILLQGLAHFIRSLSMAIRGKELA